MGITVADLAVVLRAESMGLDSSVRGSTNLISNLAATAAAASARLEEVAALHAKAMAGGDVQQAARTQVMLTQSIAAQKEVIEKQGLQSHFARVEAETQKEWDAKEQRMSIQMQQYKDRIGLEDKLYAATHSRQETLLREFQSYYARLRVQHADNAKALMVIDQLYEVNMQRMKRGGKVVESMHGGVTGEVGEPEGGQGVIGMLGGRRIAKQEIKFAAHMAGAQIPGLQLLSYAATAGSFATAGLIAGILTVGATYQAATHQAAKLVETQQKLKDYMRESAEWSQKMAASYTTGPGEQIRSRLEELRKAYRELWRESQKEAKEIPIFDRIWANIQKSWRGGLEKTDYGIHVRDTAAKMQAQQNDIAKGEAWDKVEEAVQRYRRAVALAADATSSFLTTMGQGSVNKKDMFDQSQTDTRRKFLEEQQDRMRSSQRDNTWGADARLKEEQKRQTEELTKFDEMQAWKSVAFTQAANLEKFKDHSSTNQAWIAATKEGFAQEKAAMEERYAAEVEEYFRLNKDKQEIQERFAANSMALERKQAQAIHDIYLTQADRQYVLEGGKTGKIARERAVGLAVLQRQLDLQGANPAQRGAATGAFNRANALEDQQAIANIVRGLQDKLYLTTATGRQEEIARRDLQEQLMLRQATNKEIQDTLGLMDRVNAAAATKTIMDQVKDLNLQYAVARGGMTEIEAEMIRIQRDNPYASKTSIDELRKAKEYVSSAKFAEKEKEQLYPDVQLQKYVDEVMKAMNQGALSSPEAADLLRRHLDKTGGLPETGKFVKMSDRWQDIQGQLLTRADPNKPTVDAVNAVERKIDELKREGFRLRAN